MYGTHVLCSRFIIHATFEYDLWPTQASTSFFLYVHIDTHAFGAINFIHVRIDGAD